MTAIRPAATLLGQAMAASVLIVDDHRGFRSIARLLLESAGYEVAGEAGDGAKALEMARRLEPDVVLLDIELPGMNGFAVAEELAEWPEPRRSCSSRGGAF